MIRKRISRNWELDYNPGTFFLTEMPTVTYLCDECGKFKKDVYNPSGNYQICKKCLENKKL